MRFLSIRQVPAYKMKTNKCKPLTLVLPSLPQGHINMFTSGRSSAEDAGAQMPSHKVGLPPGHTL